MELFLLRLQAGGGAVSSEVASRRWSCFFRDCKQEVELFLLRLQAGGGAVSSEVASRRWSCFF